MPKNATDLEDLNASRLVKGTVSPSRLGAGYPDAISFLRGDSTWVVFTPPVAGADTQVQYNTGGGMGASSNFTFNYTTNTLTANNVVGNGAGVTNLNASNIASGVVATARLASGVANSSTFLCGDGTWKSPLITPPGGPNLSVQIQTAAGYFYGDSNFTFNSTSTPPNITLNGTLDLIAINGPTFQYWDTNTNILGGVTNFGGLFGTSAAPCACGRLTFDANHPASNGSYTGTNASMLYYLPMNGAYITLWNSSLGNFENVRIPDAGWSLNLTGKAGASMYDVYILNNQDGTAQLVLSSPWNSPTVRGATVTLSSPINGMLFDGTNKIRRYVGTLYTQAAGQGADTPALRLLWNAHNQVPRKLFFTYGSGNWSFTIPTGSTVVRAVNNDPNNARMYWVVGVVGSSMGTAGIPWISVDSAQLFNIPVAGITAYGGVALDVITPTAFSNEITSQCSLPNMTTLWNRFCPTTQITTPGLHWLTLMEGVQNTSGATNGPAFWGGLYCCMSGLIWG